MSLSQRLRQPMVWQIPVLLELRLAVVSLHFEGLATRDELAGDARRGGQAPHERLREVELRDHLREFWALDPTGAASRGRHGALPPHSSC